MFAAIAVILAGIGVYGVMATLVRQRTAEIGVRMAIGAAPSHIFRKVIAQALRMGSFGIAGGFVAAFALTRAMQSMLIGIRPTDPVTFVSAAAMFLIIVAAASWLPARRAAALDPSLALREE